MKKEEPKKEIGFITVINFIAGILLLLFGIGLLIIRDYLSGSLILALVVFLFFPQKIWEINKWLKLLIVVACFIVIAIVNGVNMPSTEPEFMYYNLNEDFILTFNNVNFSMIIYNTTKETKILIDDEEITTEGIFLFVHGAVTNLGKTATDFGFYSELTDSQNNSYSVISFYFGTAGLQPNLKKSFFNVFEIPKNASGLKFSVADNTNVVRIINLEV